jgi:LPXTG-motif cell wall-anchored protein
MRKKGLTGEQITTVAFWILFLILAGAAIYYFFNRITR